MPSSNDRLSNLIKVFRILSGKYLSTIVGILSKPELRLGFNLPIISFTSSMFVGVKKNDDGEDVRGR